MDNAIDRLARWVADASRAESPVRYSRHRLVRIGSRFAVGAVGFGLFSRAPWSARAQDEAAAPVDSFAVEAEGINRPGKYSRKEGIESWDVKRKQSGYKVKFKHQRRELSGELEVNFSDNGQTGTSLLTRDRERFQMAFSGGRIAATDADGKQMTLVWDERRRQWEADAASERRIKKNEKDFRLSFAIAGDLAPRPGSRSGSAIAEVDDATRQASCDENRQLSASSGPFPTWTRSLACDYASTELRQSCEVAVACDGCCRTLDCDCVCVPYLLFSNAEFGCNCLRIGYPYPVGTICESS